MSDKFHFNLMGFSDHCKGVPYFGGEREDGGVNYGFTNPKSLSREELLGIPEVSGDPGYEYAIPKINLGRTGYFTIGCEKSHNHDKDNEDRDVYSSKGYIEFAFNHRNMITDASHYFPLFFKFDEYARRQKADNKIGQDFQFLWELAPNHFHDFNLGGFSATLWLNTRWTQSQDETMTIWTKAWTLISDFMVEFTSPLPENTPSLYPSTQPTG